MIYFWAKTTKDNKPGISVFEHMVNVGYVARCMAELAPALLKRFQLKAATVGALSALHDLGKISPGFQRKCEAWLDERGLLQIARNWVWDTSMESDHGKTTHATVQKYFNDIGLDRGTGKFLSAVLGGHHGKLSPPNDRGFKPKGQITENQSGIDWERERNNAADAIRSVFGVNMTGLAVEDSSPALWWLAGLTSVADWIGSDARYFSVEGGMKVSQIVETAKRCLDEIGCARPQIVSGLSFHDLFHDIQKPDVQFAPNNMQSSAISIITDPGVYVIEAPMGMGKTEAALGAAYQLLATGKVHGIYFALPTQATSNRMHLRMAEFVKRIAPDAVGSRIIHGNSWLMDKAEMLSPATTIKDDMEDAVTGRDWFSSAKRSLLAPFGVGTVDQALLGVVAAKHFFVRHFALAGKVVILDEVHSYDLYTGTLIDRLIETLEGLGCTVIVLSATLSGKRRGQIVSIPEDNDTAAAEHPYPLVTGRRTGNVIDPIASIPPEARDIGIAFKSEVDATSEAIEMALKGGCVLLVCNTVNEAQRQYSNFLHRNGASFPIGLLHSRFPFWRREELENEWMERLGKDSATRCGSILVSTQIVEQSVDLDADLLITELAPTDMLLQRMGRLWRHKRENRPISTPKMYIIEEEKSLDEFRQMGTKAIVKALGGKAHVYNPYVLLRSLEVWRGLEQVISIPKQIRRLIEATYEEHNDEPEAWRKLFDERFATDSGRKFLADRNSNLWQVVLEDEEGRQTRLNEVTILSLVLCRSFSKKKAEFIDGTSAILGGEEFHLATAQGIHRNLVKIPEYHFTEVEAYAAIAKYLRGAQCVGLVGGDGTVSVKGLKNGVLLRWNKDLGLVLEKSAEEVD
ncbi:MAG: CRISPR-associated helicase Cas3' [Nitrospirota bacterium]